MHVEGTAITAMPLALTLLAAVVVWRLGLRLGDSVSGHGPDADAIADGMRDWTVPSATAVFTLGYVAVAVVTHHLAATPATAPSLARTVAWTILLCGLVGGMRDRRRLGAGGDLDVVPAALAPRRGGRRLAHSRLVRRGVGRRARRRAGRSTGTAR